MGRSPIGFAVHKRPTVAELSEGTNFSQVFSAMVLVAMLAACSRSSVVTPAFEASRGDILSLPVEHSGFPFPRTDLYFYFDPPIADHPSRDFSDVVSVKAYGEENEIFEVSKIYDVNGLGRTIQVSFVEGNPDIAGIEISFGTSCSGEIEIRSWQPL